ncbi:MAG: transposase, partial [Candidatus Freyarchaeota archaeon]|nr:transposase [Candidatus Jordarchaeia archaeon]
VWDCNEKSLDGFNPEIGWIRVDLRRLFHIHRVYELKRRRLQSKASRKQSLRRVLEKYSNREKNRAKDFIHKVTRVIAEAFRGYVHGFEDLNKEKMFRKSRNHNRKIAKSDWRTIISLMSYKSRVRLLNPHNSSRRCSSGMVNAPKGALYECKSCGLKIDRQLNACLNLYLQVEGLPPSQKLFNELVRGWGGFALTGGEADAGSDEPVRSFKACEPQGLSMDQHLPILSLEPFG